VLPHEVVAEALEWAVCGRSAEGEAAGALVGSVLHGGDGEFVERWCVRVGTRAVPGSPLLGLGGLCLGRLARRLGRLGGEALALGQSLAACAEAGPSDVEGRALDGYDVVRGFLHLR
jgi:hypothetical protein